MAGVRLYHVVKKIKGKNVLDDVTLEIKEGELTCLLGPAKCGKTTLLKVIAGLEPVDSGEIYIDDKSLKDIPPWERPISTVFEDYFTYRRGGPRTRIGYHIMFRRWIGRVAKERANAIFRMMKVEPVTLLGKVHRRRSKGEQQSLDLVRYLVTRRQIFLLDDPFLSLDVKTRESMREELDKIVRQFKVTTIYVTQELKEAEIFSDKVVIMRDGQIEQIGTFEELEHSPNSEFVANFLKRRKA